MGICAQVFCSKIRAMRTYIKNGEIFGEVGAHVRVIEFQNRGFPHAQCIFLLNEYSKVSLLQLSFLDSITSAKITSSNNKVLRKVFFKSQHA